jgi:hypothetical protein
LRESLLLFGPRACAAHTDGVHNLSGHLDDAHVRELSGVGHAAPMLAPERPADEVVRFFEERLATA